MTLDEIKSRIKELRRLRRDGKHEEAEQRLNEELLDHGFYLAWIRQKMDYGVFVNEHD